MKLFNFESIKKSSIYITPNLPVIETKRYKLSFLNVLYILFGYSFFVMLLTITFLALTPAKELIFILENEDLVEQADRIKDLEAKVIFLTRNIEEMASSNQKIKYAMMLAGVDSLDSVSAAAVYDSLKADNKNRLPAEGNVYKVFKKLCSKYFQSKENNDKDYFVKPMNGFITRNFDPAAGHMGIDLAAKTGSPVFASAGGMVMFSDYTNDDGYMMILQHDNGFTSIYKHCSVLMKTVREYVHQGEVIALSGNTGTKTSGPHLHFELWKEGKVVDPQKILIN